MGAGERCKLPRGSACESQSVSQGFLSIVITDDGFIWTTHFSKRTASSLRITNSKQTTPHCAFQPFITHSVFIYIQFTSVYFSHAMTWSM